MFRTKSASAAAATAAFGLATLAIACGDKNLTDFTNVVVVPSNMFTQTNLVADTAGYNAVTIDPLLVNPWGVAFDGNGALWVANAGSGTATSYDIGGAKLAPTISIPAAGTPAITPVSTPPIGSPTGIVRNTTADFNIPIQGAAEYIFASEDGAISA